VQVVLGRYEQLTLSSAGGQLAPWVGAVAADAAAPSPDAGVLPTSCSAAGGSCIAQSASCTGVSGDPSQYDCGGAKDVQCCIPPLVCGLGNDPLPCTDNTQCAPYGAHCVHTASSAGDACACNTQNCMPGQDQTCNQDPAMSALAGTCDSFGACLCHGGFSKNPSSGKCAPSACPATAPTQGASCPPALLSVSCSYLPNTTCTCVSGIAGDSWACAF
jgi:hypothetical protein